MELWIMKPKNNKQKMNKKVNKVINTKVSMKYHMNILMRTT